MTQTRTLIVNHGGHLSALPTTDELSLGGYACDPGRFYCYEVMVDDNHLLAIWQHRDNTLVISTDTPIKSVADIVDPTYQYVQVLDEIPLRLVPVAVPEGVDLSYAKALATARLARAFAQAKASRFASSALGSPHYYDGSDFLLFAMAFVNIGEAGLFSCASTATGPYAPVPHTVAQVQAAGADFRAWYQNLQATYYGLQTQVDAATTVAEVDAINWV